ncbi:hypothetical protein J3A83DRAFT_4085356 [Scleroderma citrinum]
MSHLVSFPASESVPVVPLPVPHLPFRRISLPSAPNLAAIAHRHSVMSISSDAEEALVLAQQHKRGKRRSLNPGARPRRRTPADEARDAKRGKVISEFYDTEKSYLGGLDLVYNHFLTPILASLDTGNPLLTRREITTLFSNFIDIWNFHHAFFTALTAHLHPPPSSSSLTSQYAPLSSLLLAHFPYLSLYTPFITAFPTSIQLLLSLSQNNSPNPSFKEFLRTQESHPRCAHLRLSDYLLTPVQRCPRYLLLLKDLLAATDPTDPEWDKLQEVQSLVEKITSSLNTSLATHAQTLALLSLQRNTRDLPSCVTPLVAPGRELIKRGTLIREGATGEGWGRQHFEFILSSDYLLWLEHDEAGIILSHPADASPRPRRLILGDGSDAGEDEKWICRGCISLVDMEVVMALDRSGTGDAHARRLEILSPEGSFALYSDGPNGLTSWITALRLTRATCLAAVALSHPDSTLSASASNIHVRRTLRAFASESNAVNTLAGGKPTGRDPSTSNQVSRSCPRRAQLDNFLPPVWVPDAKTDACMRCGRPFGFDRGAWRRKHHCRLCGRVVCAACSGRTFYIVDADDSLQSHSKSKAKTARACDECYEAAFPIIIDSSPIKDPSMQPLPSAYLGGSSVKEVTEQTSPTCTSILLPPDEDPDTICGIQPWLTIPSRQGQSTDVGEALMAMDAPGALSRTPSHARLTRVPSHPGLNGMHMRAMEVEDGDESSHGPVPVGPIRIRPPTARPRSYHDILEDFGMHERGLSVPSSILSGAAALDAVKEGEGERVNEEGGDDVEADQGAGDEGGYDGGLAQAGGSGDESTKVGNHTREDTARRRKRFSLPAVALQTAPVFARARSKEEALRRRSHAGGESGGFGRRFSLVQGSDGLAMGMLMDVLKGKPRPGT